MKVYAGPPAAARAYLEADRGRADDYYLAEGTGQARRFVARAGRMEELASLTGETYEVWVAGRDPETGDPRGRLRTDERAVRFVEVVVNGPKSWSLAAAVHPDVAAAYDAAQDRAAAEIIGWLAGHATTRIGPRGGQVQVPVEVLEAVTVRHYTSRAGDPHRHQHLQIGARVFAAGRWRGLHTVGVRDFLAAINGIGHAAVACDPQFRAALAAHGYTLDETGEILELAEYVGPFSARAAQIGRNLDRYERDWTAAHPGESPGPALRRTWDARAWADGRPDKVTPRSGTDLTVRWRAELAALGYSDPDTPVQLSPTPVGVLDRDRAANQILTRLAAGRSAWNAADLRGEAERLIAGAGIVADTAVRSELAEDLTARALARCLPLLQRDGVPEHVRAWTSPAVLEVEADLAARLAARGGHRDADADLRPERVADLELLLDPGQTATAAALAGNRPLIVVEGAAGVGKTTTLAAIRRLLAQQGRGLLVVTPTLKAARVATAEVGTAAGSAAWLAFQHGWRWTDDGAWTRLTPGEVDPVTGRRYGGPEENARLRPGDVLVVDEAGMLDQDTARALLVVADECQVRVALLGDRRQLAAVGRGGVLDLAARHVDPTAHLTLAEVHRFTATTDGVPVPDSGYAELTLAMRGGTDPGAVFDALAARGQIRLHPDQAALSEALAALAAEQHRQGEQTGIVVDTREQAATLNAAIRHQLVADGRVDDRAVVTTRAGERIGAGDRIATRRNDRTLGVANRDTWTVISVRTTGDLVVTPADAPRDHVTPSRVTPGDPGRDGVIPGAVGERVLPTDYVTEQVELAYASTAHGVQGDTVPTAHVVIGEHTGAASAYVGMTRGRCANTAHLVAVDLADAREQWIAVFARDRADLGPAHAAQQAAAEAARYATPRPLNQVLAELRQAWTAEQNCLDRLAFWQRQRDTLRQVAALEAAHAAELTGRDADVRQTALAAERATHRAAASGAAIAAEAGRIRQSLLARWDGERDAARAAARVVLAGPGRLGLRRTAVARAAEQLTSWAGRWRPHLPDLPTEATELAQVAGWFDDRPALWRAFDTAAGRSAERDHPEHAGLRAAADAAGHAHDDARRALAEARRRRDERLASCGPIARAPEPGARLADLERDIAAIGQQLTDARVRITGLTAEPALLAQPADRLAREHDAWRARHDVDRRAARTTVPGPQPGPTRAVRPPRPEDLRALDPQRGPDRSVPR
jgi:hypothetical protein